MRFHRSLRGILTAVLAVCLSVALARAEMAKNVILLISDGQGFNTIKATNMWSGGPAIYESFPYRFGVSTFAYTRDTPDPAKAAPLQGYDPARAWTSYEYLRTNPTDSGAAGTAMATGQKTYKTSLNYDLTGSKKLTTITEMAHSLGKATGVVSTVQWSHATPAAFGAHNLSRNNYAAIAQEMLDGSPTLQLKVIMGAGNPDYDDNGRPAAKDPKYVGGADYWSRLKAGTLNGWTLIQDERDFQALADGTYKGGNLPDKVVGTFKAYTTGQQARSYPAGTDPTNPSTVKFNRGMPSLATMTRGALNVLGKDPDGLFLLVEGGAVDWASHANQLGRMIEEQRDFNAAVQAVVEWVNANSNWKETLVLVTTDHECGLLWGPKGDFSPLVDRGPQKLPGARYNSKNHTNSLVPLYALGAGAERLSYLADQFDPQLQTFFGDMGFDGRYLDNTEVFQVMAAGPMPKIRSLAVGFRQLSTLLREPRGPGWGWLHLSGRRGS